MARVNAIDSGVVSTRIAKQQSETELPASPVWLPVEVESYEATGSEVSTEAPLPISERRQPLKGEVTGVTANAGFQVFANPSNQRILYEGFLWHQPDSKTQAVTAVNGTSKTFTVADGSGFVAGMLVWATGFGAAANNGLHKVASATATTVVVSTGTATEAAPPTGAQLTRVGYEFASATLDVDAPTDSLPSLDRASGTVDFTTLGLVSGQALFIGDGTATNSFATAVNNGVKRVRSVAADAIQLDKSERALADETGTRLAVRVFFGVAVKNATARQYFQIERQLGAPDDAKPNEIQAQYLTGLSPGELSIEIDSQSLMRATFNFQGIDEETVSADTALKAGTRPAYVGEGTFNTAADVKHINMAPVSQTEEAPDTYFGIPNAARFTLNNNLNAYVGIGRATPYAINADTPEIGGNLTSSFVDVAALKARRENTDVTVDAFMVKDNRGWVIDLPLVSVGGSPPEIARGAPITLSLDFTAGEATKVHDGYDHAVMMTFFDYLPDAAAA